MTSKITRVEVRYVPDDKIADVTPLAMLGMPDGFLPPEQLEQVDTPGFEHSKRAIGHPKNLETIYKAFQVVDGTDDERCAQLKIRGMTYGDAVIVDEVDANGKILGRSTYYVAAEGFVTRDAEGELVPVTAT